ncbi:hypothetical protein [Streptomyces cucumeris]|uniref:hypothetical protein n=1 Tax=Streptomyces cucumeris TaxID=2962890 RepID=UPI003D70D778
MTRPAAVCAAAVLLSAMAPAIGAGVAPAPRIDPRVLVLDDKGPATAAITAELKGSGTPYTDTTVDLTASGRSVPVDPSGTASAARAAEPADRLPVPAGVRKPVPYGPGDATRA